jgi:hypothetical protein
MPCAGNPANETCGGSARVSVYNNSLLVPPSHKPRIASGTGVGEYAFLGCFTDMGPRTLQGYGFSAPNMTQEVCVGACAARGWRAAGVEYAEQCFCGSEVNVSGDGKGGVKVAEGECAMLCKGDRAEFCGASSRIGVWVAG